ncbi:putative membrane protein [Pseudoduganella flava]|nr:putative membrane protein [Pseudoduganella flava]
MQHDSETGRGMGKSRLEAFSDGVIAIIITIMVLELKVPHEATIDALLPLWPLFFSYVLSFVYVGIYWNNHHHLLQLATRVDGRALWANLHLLFWLSLLPFATNWLGEHSLAAMPMATYGAVLLMCAIAYEILVRSLVALHGPQSGLARAIGRDVKGWVSIVLYAAGVPLSFWLPWLGAAFYVGLALLWIRPDPRVERHVASTGG